MGFASSAFHKERGEEKKNHTTLLQGPSERKKKNRTLLQRPPLSYLLKPQHIRCLQMPPPPSSLPLSSKRIAESLHRKIQIVSRAVRLPEHKLRGEALLSLSNILSIIHKEEGKIKRCWLALKKEKNRKKKVLDCEADTAVTYGLMWVFFFFYLPQLSEIYIPGGCIHCARHCTDMKKTNDRHGNASLSDWLPAGANYSAYLLLAQLLCEGM